MNNQIKLPEAPATHSLIADIFRFINDRIGRNTIIGFYLGGSLALGDFDEETSDVDFLIIVNKSIDSVMLDSLRQMHNDIRQQNKNRLYTNYEGVYLTDKQAYDPTTIDMHAPHLGSDGHFDIEDHGSELIIDLWKIRKSGFVVYGKDPMQVIGNISNKDMIDAKVDLFKSWWLPKLESKEAMDDEYQVYAVLTMTRIVYGIANLDEVSKKKSAQWCIKKYPDYSSVIKDAQNWKPGNYFDAVERVYDFIDFTNQHIKIYTKT